VVTELSKFIDWPETGLEEINRDLPEEDFGTMLSESGLEHNFQLARYPAIEIVGAASRSTNRLRRTNARADGRMASSGSPTTIQNRCACQRILLDIMVRR